jgi:hypothetical protein
MPIYPASCERRPILPLIEQPGGMAGYSGKSISRTFQLVDFGHAAPSKEVVLMVYRRSA